MLLSEDETLPIPEPACNSEGLFFGNFPCTGKIPQFFSEKVARKHLFRKILLFRYHRFCFLLPFSLNWYSILPVLPIGQLKSLSFSKYGSVPTLAVYVVFHSCGRNSRCPLSSPPFRRFLVCYDLGKSAVSVCILFLRCNF